MLHKHIKLRLIETFIWFALIGLPPLFAMTVLLNYIKENQEFRITSNVERKQQEMLSLSKYQVEYLFKGVYDDLRVLRRSNDFEGYLFSEEEDSRVEAGRMFIRFLNSKPQYLRIGYIDREGGNVIGARQAGSYVSGYLDSVPGEEGENAWFLDAKMTDGSTLYIFDFRLDVSGEEGVRPYQPVLRFAIPVYRGDSHTGYLLIDYDGFSFLQILDTYEGNRAFNINQAVIDKGHIIDMNVFDSEESLFTAFSGENGEASELWRLIGTGDRVFLDYRGRRYYARQISSDQTYSLQFHGEGANWILVSSYSRDEVLEEWGVGLIHYPLTRFLSVFMVELLVFFSILIVLQRKTDSLQMEASRYIAEFSHDAIMITDSGQNLIYCNGGFERIFGFSLGEIAGKKPKEFLQGQTVMSFKESDRSDLVWEGNVWDRTRDDIYIQKYLKVKVVKTGLKKPAFYIGVYSEPKFIYSIGSHNSLPPSSYFSEKSMEYLYPDMGRLFHAMGLNTIILIKLTDIAFLHNQLSDEETDNLVHSIVGEIRKIAGGTGKMVIPASGFILVSARTGSGEDLSRFMEELHKAVSHLSINDQGFPMQYRAGVALTGEGEAVCDTLVHNAFIALEALASMKDVTYLVFNRDIYEEVIRRREIKNEIENAFLHDEFSVVYQLQEECRSRDIIGVEALLRWNNGRLGAVSPALFVPIMEETSQIKRLGKHVVGKILEEFDAIAGCIEDRFCISINLSIQEFNDAALVDEIIAMISRSNVPREKICFEITETLLSENLAHTGRIIEMFHHNGMKVAIDDFGTGYSSLSYLKNLKADKIKIDRAFIKDYPEDDNGSILRAITNLALDLDINLILEGIETEEQLAFARDIGCQEFQGYLSSRPIPMEELSGLLGKNRTP